MFIDSTQGSVKGSSSSTEVTLGVLLAETIGVSLF